MKFTEFKTKAIQKLVKTINTAKSLREDIKKFYIDELNQLAQMETFEQVAEFLQLYEYKSAQIMQKQFHREEVEQWHLISNHHIRYIYELCKIAAGYTTASPGFAEDYLEILGKDTIDLRIVEVTEEELTKVDRTVL